MKAGLITAMLIDCMAAIAAGAARRSRARMTKVEKAKNTPPISPAPSAATKVAAVRNGPMPPAPVRPARPRRPRSRSRPPACAAGLPAEAGWQKAEARDREALGAEQVAAEQIGGEPRLRRRAPEAAQRHVRGELAPLRVDPDIIQHPLDPSPQGSQSVARVLDADPQRVRRAARRELAQPLQGQLERRVADPGEGLADLVEQALPHLADEPQGQMKLVGLGPAHAGQTLAQPVQRRADVLGTGPGQ